MQFSPSNISDQVAALCSLLVLLFCACNASAQTKEQLGAKHKEVTAFEIEPGIVAFSTFTRDGDVCEITIHKLGYVDSQHSDFDSTIPDWKVDHVVDEVVAPTERGKPSKYLSPNHGWQAVQRSSGKTMKTYQSVFTEVPLPRGQTTRMSS